MNGLTIIMMLAAVIGWESGKATYPIIKATFSKEEKKTASIRTISSDKDADLITTCRYIILNEDRNTTYPMGVLLDMKQKEGNKK